MAVTLTAAQRALLQSGRVAVRTLMDFYLDSGRASFWDGHQNMAFDGTTYYAASDVLEISAINLGRELGAEGITIRLNGTKLQEASPDPLDPGALFGTMESVNYQMRRVEIRFAFFDPDTGAMIMVVRRYTGFIDQARQVEDVNDDGSMQCWLVLSIESILRRYGVRGGRTRSHDDQQDIWASDTGFKFTASTIEKQGTLYWGRLPPGANHGVPPVLQGVYDRIRGITRSG